MALNIRAKFLLHMIIVDWVCNLELDYSFFPLQDRLQEKEG